jgi:hypothetical protein
MFELRLESVNLSQMGSIWSICVPFLVPKEVIQCLRLLRMVQIVKHGRIHCVVMIIVIRGLQWGSVRVMLVI